MKTKENVIAHLKAWAENQSIKTDNDNYVKKRDENFFRPLNVDTVRDLMGGDGEEYKADESIRTKIFALHSSSALVCNVFDYWRNKDKEPLQKALKFGKKGIKTFVLEQKLSMGMKGKMPNLDLFMIFTDGTAVAIESKFTEWMNKKSKKQPFAESYFENNSKRWTKVGLPNCQILAEKIYRGKEKFDYLDAAQLLKHALGLANTHSSNSSLLYLFYNLNKESDLSKNHREEINRFKESLGSELNFRAISYQDLFDLFPKDSDQVDYNSYYSFLKNRYF